MHTATYSNDPREYAEREARAATLNDRIAAQERFCPPSDAEVADALEQRAKEYMRQRVLEVVAILSRLMDVRGNEQRLEGVSILARQLLADRDIGLLDEAERLVAEAMEEGRRAA